MKFPPISIFFNWRVILAAIVFLLFSLGFFVARHRWPAGLACWIVYLLLLAPVSGVAQSGLQLVADRYSYLSCMVWAILLAAVLSRLWRPGTDGVVRPVGAALLIRDSFVRAFRIRCFDLETDRDLARFGETLEPRACRASFGYGLPPCGQVLWRSVAIWPRPRSTCVAPSKSIRKTT